MGSFTVIPAIPACPVRPETEQSANVRIYDIGTSRGADAGCLYGLNTQHNPWRASRLAWRAGGDDKAFLDAHQPVYFTFELGDLPLVLGQRTRRVRDMVSLERAAVVPPPAA